MPDQRINSAQQIKAAESFVERWRGRGDEKQETQKFWNDLLINVLGVKDILSIIDYEKPVSVVKLIGRENGAQTVIDFNFGDVTSARSRTTKFADGWIQAVGVLIEQKSFGIDVFKRERQSDGQYLNAIEQAERYAQNLRSDTTRFLLISNFGSFYILDRQSELFGNPEEIVEIKLESLPEQLHVFQFLVDEHVKEVRLQQEVSIEAANRLGKLYPLIEAEYKKAYGESEEYRHDLAVFMVRLLYCLYAEDSGLFNKMQFYNYLKGIEAETGEFRRALKELFEVLDKPVESRSPLLPDVLKAFPYVNGGLFKDIIDIPVITADIRFQLLFSCAQEFNWSRISPVIFGSLFESVLSGEARSSGGIHYTSPENIHKVIDALFLNDLVEEVQSVRHDKRKLLELQKKIAELKFLDPACGSGNFLTESYTELRKIENKILRFIRELDGLNPEQISTEIPGASAEEIMVNIGQFYGIEINDFAVNVANTALWIAEHQANLETEKILSRNIEYLPLKDYQHIVCGNALRLDWNDVVPAGECSFIMGNPPFLGYAVQNSEQKKDAVSVFGAITQANSIDYVGAWYHKAAQYIQNSQIRVAFVSTNSVTQGEQVSPLWGKMFKNYGVQIDYGYRTFKWESESKGKAAVHCVIIGFSAYQNDVPKIIYYDNNVKIAARNINPYLLDAPNVLIANRSEPICNVPRMILGNMPKDGNGLVLTDEERNYIVKTEPLSDKWIRSYIGSFELINNKPRWCLWLVGANPSDLKNSPEILKRVERVRRMREDSKALSTRKLADTPTLFAQRTQPENLDYIAIPRVSSERRLYTPIGFLQSNVIASDQLFIIPGATIYHFGILTSLFHNAWMRIVAGRLKSDYRYSKDIVYNNYVWPVETAVHKEKISSYAKKILEARDNYPESSLADLYDPLTMPPDLLKAHKALDRAVEQAYGVDFKGDEEKIVAHLFNLYSQRVSEE